MPRIRFVKPETFDDPDLCELPPLARWLFVGLWTQADREGRMEDDPRRVKTRLLPADVVDPDDVLKLLTPRFITRYVVDGRRFLQINNFVKHQRPHPKEAQSVIPAPAERHGKPLKARASKPDSGILILGSCTSAAPKEPDPRVREFIRWFHDEYAKRRDGAKYVVKGAKDGQLVRRLLQTHDPERLKKHAVILLTSNEEWIEGTDRGIGILAAKINWLEDRLTVWEKKHGQNAR